MFRFIKSMSNTIRKRLLFLFLSTTLLSSTISLFVFFTFSNLTDNMGSMFETSTLLDGMLEDLDTANTNLHSFLTTRDNESLLNFSRMTDRLQSFADVQNKSKTQNLYMRDICNMIPSYLQEANLAIDARRARDPIYIDYYARANRTLNHIQSYSDTLNIMQLQNNTDLYNTQSKYIGWMKFSSIVMIAGMIVLSIFLVLYTTYKMTDPIVRLSRASEEIAAGNFETAEIPVSGEEEIRVMANAFNRMKDSIRIYIEELQNKSETETMLLEQQMQNMKMHSLLDSSRLQALQAQINPHFLFNTLNAGIQLSVMEGSDRTTKFLENLSDLFRYNIRKPDAIVSLNEEIQHVKAYTELMKVRFGDAIRFIFDLEDNAMTIGIPPLTIQTLVENACIHGLGDSENGIVRIRVMDMTDTVQISVSDNGAGMESDIIDDIYTRSNDEHIGGGVKRPGHTTGIGLTNVIQRLRLHTGAQEVLKILSAVGTGTTITIIIPKMTQEVEHAEIDGSR